MEDSYFAHRALSITQRSILMGGGCALETVTDGLVWLKSR